MANTPLQSITFDSLPDTYLIPVQSVNGQTGVVVLDAEDEGALPDDTTAADIGAYVKPSGGIPKTDLASGVKTSLRKADDVDDTIYGESLIDASTISSSTNTKVTNNGDGTYTIGTGDYGSTVFGSPITLPAGTYILYGVPQGTAYLSTDGSWNNTFASNAGSHPIVFTNAAERTCYLGFRMSSSPSVAFEITPYLRKPGLVQEVDGKIDKPSSPATGAFLVWSGSAWVAQTLSTWQGGSY